LGILLWGTSSLFATLAYFYYANVWYLFAIAALLTADMMLYIALWHSLKKTYGSAVATLLSVSVWVLFWLLRWHLHRFDFYIGDASDYYSAGIYAAKLHQDIGFFMPLSSAWSGVGFRLFGLDHLMYIYLLLHAAAPPILYYVARYMRMGATIALAVMMLLTLLPLDIWLSKSSYSDPIWFVAILAISVPLLRLTTKTKPFFGDYLAIGSLLISLPWLRGESVLLLGLIGMVAWWRNIRFCDYKSAMILSILMALSIAMIITTTFKRTVYLLAWQYARLFPHITSETLLYILGSMLVGSMLIAQFLASAKLRHAPFVSFMMLLVVATRILIPTLYGLHDDGISVLDSLLGNEMSFVLGNFSIVGTLLVYGGLLRLAYRGLHGDIKALIVWLGYLLFYLPFMIQKCSFIDAHAFFLYWSRYYLADLAAFHLLAIGVALDLVLRYMPPKRGWRLGLLFSLLIAIVPYRAYPIVITEAHHPQSHQIYRWLKQKVQRFRLNVLYDANILYEQNRGHAGCYDIKHMMKHNTLLFEMDTSLWQAVSMDHFDRALLMYPNLLEGNYLLTVTRAAIPLYHPRLMQVASFRMSLQWREHRSVRAEKEGKPPVALYNSIVHDMPLLFTLYRIKQQFDPGITFFPYKSDPISDKLFAQGWALSNTYSGAWMVAPQATLHLPIRPTPKAVLNLQLFVNHASETNPCTLVLSSNKHIISQFRITQSYLTDANLTIGATQTITFALMCQDIQSSNPLLFLRALKLDDPILSGNTTPQKHPPAK